MKALYDQNIEFIELTKLLEREICDTMTVTNSLYRDYAVGVNPATVTTSSGLGSYKGNFMTPYLSGAEIAKGMWRKERAGQTAVRCRAEKHAGGDGVEDAFDVMPIMRIQSSVRSCDTLLPGMVPAPAKCPIA